MAWNYSISAQFYDIEVLKWAQPIPVTKPVVIDANAITLNASADARTVVPAGTPLEKSSLNAKQVMPYAGTNVGALVGILQRSIDIIAAATNGDQPASVYYRLAAFATTAIVGFTSYAAHFVTAFPTCSFE